MSDKKQIPGLPVATEAKDNDRLIKRDMDSGADEGLAVSLILGRSSEQVDAHATEEGGIHGIPVGERALHTGETPDFPSMPTVAGTPVVESGSNSDGEWTRWADGTQHCSSVDPEAFASDSAVGESTLQFPLPFFTLDGLLVTVSLARNTTGGNTQFSNIDCWEKRGAESVNSVTVTFGRSSNAGSGTVDIKALTVGRWK